MTRGSAIHVTWFCFRASLFMASMAWSLGSVADDNPEGTVIPPDPEFDAVRRMLDIAWSKEKQAPQQVKHIYDTFKPQVRDRRRWHYAYAIASLKLKRFPAAVQAFQASRQAPGDFEFAAWKGQLWTEFTLKRYDDGLDHLKTLAETIDAKDFAASAAEKARVAGWIGQSLAALEKIVTAPKTKTRLADLDLWLRESWSDDLCDAYQAGRDLSDMQYEDLMSDVQQAGEDGEFRDELARADRQRAVKQGLADAEKQRGELKKSAQELQQQAEQKVKDIDKQLARLEGEYTTLDLRAKSLLKTITQLQLQLQQALLQRQDSNGKQNSAPVSSVLLERMEFQLAMYQQEYDVTLMRANLVVQRAMQGVQLRQQTIQQLQKVTGDLNRQDASLGKWQDRLASAGENLKTAKIKGAGKTVRQKKQDAKSLNTYLEFDPEWERIRLTEPAEVEPAEES